MSPFAGRWNLTVTRPDLAFPSWLELVHDAEGWTGRFVGIWGSARPIPTIQVEGDALRFQLPPQYEGFPSDLVFEAKLVEGRLVGTTNTADGGQATWVGERAPDLPAHEPQWGAPMDLLESLEGWLVRWPEMPNHWSLGPDGLANAERGTDLLTEAKFGDFKLLAEYSYPEGSNSGIYLRGRYELQILDDHGKPPAVGGSGAIYGFLQPPVNAVKPAGERNVIELELVGRHLTMVMNGVELFHQAEIPGITGGAVDSREGEPGTLLVQGDHGPVTFHRLVLTPALDAGQE